MLGTPTRTSAQALPAAPARPRLRTSGRLLPWAASVALLAVAAVLGVTHGAAEIPLTAAFALLFDWLPLVEVRADVPASWERILVDVRLPRVVASAMVGGALAFSGASYQGVFRNPLADPFLLGVASGAGLGAAIAIVSPLPVDSYGFGWVPLFAFAGALLAVSVVYMLSRTGRAVDNATLLLAGIALSAIASALTSFMLLTGGDRAFPILSFLFGGFNTASWPRILMATPYVVVGVAVIALHSRALNVLQLDEEQAAHLGVDVARTKLIVLAAASLMAAAAVAVAGIIGFVGLIVPHAVRLLFGRDYRMLLPLCALLGAAFVILVDVAARQVLAPQEVPVGIVTQILGAPFFLYLLRARRGGLLP
ncbi:MAG: iron ABC transporter permease [Dehalococcoidia bacterium]